MENNTIDFGKKFRLLVVEDNPTVSIIHKAFLANFTETYNVALDTDFAATGKEALLYYKKNNYNLILLDIRLPDISGIEVCKRIRQQEKNLIKYTPIIIITAHSDCTVQECCDMGADDFISKPLSLITLNKLLITTLFHSINDYKKFLENNKKDRR